jgi:hypothetical protein
VYTAFPCSDYYAPSDSPLGPRVFVRRFPRTPSHCACHPSGSLPCLSWRTQARWLRWHVLLTPSALCGSPVPAEGKQVPLCHLRQNRSCILPRSLLLPMAVSSLTGSHLRSGMRGAAFPVGLCVLQVIHHPISQPSATSWILPFSSWRLLGVCCSRSRVVWSA